MVISSNKYQKWEQISKSQEINIGISGLGATTHLVAMEIKKRYPLAQPIPYKSTRDSTLDLAGKRIDLNVGFPGEIESWISSGEIHALGVTGRKSVNGIPTLMSQGFLQVESMVNGHSLIVPAKLSEKTYQEWRSILLKASTASSVQQSYTVDHCDPMNYSQKQTNQWYQNQIKLWNTLSVKVKTESL
jgi:tripartite-type tricarboxylate transporter receptor subunit TctC